MSGNDCKALEWLVVRKMLYKCGAFTIYTPTHTHTHTHSITHTLMHDCGNTRFTKTHTQALSGRWLEEPFMKAVHSIFIDCEGKPHFCVFLPSSVFNGALTVLRWLMHGATKRLELQKLEVEEVKGRTLFLLIGCHGAVFHLTFS